MIWLELRTNNSIYNPGWNLTESIWAPPLKANGSKWPFWGLIEEVVKGDIIFHLIFNGAGKQFIGFSTAATDAYLTNSLPTENQHKWDFSKLFYKVDLENYKPFEPAINLSEYFANNETTLKQYFTNKGKKHLFYTIQKLRLQCLFGAYFSEFGDVLSKILVQRYSFVRNEKEVANNVVTGVSTIEMTRRIGHNEFSENVKNNFNNICCFPNCQVEGRNFLISGHIARWADNEPLRGDTGNGLCFCLMHDKAFERGYFTLNENFCVIINKSHFENRPWLADLLQHGESLEIKPRKINPLLSALRDHWQRIGYDITAYVHKWLKPEGRNS